MAGRLQEHLQRPLTRKQFLKVLGGGLLVVLNLDGIARLLEHHGNRSEPPVADGYGSSGYGGFDKNHKGADQSKPGGFD